MKERELIFRESVREILAGAVQDEELRELLRTLGAEDTMLNAIHLALCLKALKGDVQAARYLRDTAQEAEERAEEASLACLELSGLSDAQLRSLAARTLEKEVTNER